MMMRPMAFGFDGVHNFDGSRISEVGQKQAPQLNPILNQQVGNFEPTYTTGTQELRERMERRRRQASQLNPYAFQQNRIGNYNLQRRNLGAQLIPGTGTPSPQTGLTGAELLELSDEELQRYIPRESISQGVGSTRTVYDATQGPEDFRALIQEQINLKPGDRGFGMDRRYNPIDSTPQDNQQAIQDRQRAIAQVQPYSQSPFSFGLGSLGYGGFSPYGGGFSPFGMMGGYGGGMGGYGGFGGYGGMMGGFSPFGGYGGGYGGMMGGFSPFGGGFSPFGGGIYGGGIYNLPQAQQAPQQQAPQQQTAQTIQQQANPFGDSIKQQYAQPVGQTTLFR